MKKIMTFPNMLTISRVVFLPILYVLVHLELRLAFLIAFIIIASTDFFDGLLARKMGLVSKLGKVLDTVADIFFYFSCVWFFYVLYPNYLIPNVPLLIAFSVVYLSNFIISYIFTKKLIMMHTTFLRLNAVFIFILIILSYFVNTTYVLSFILFTFMIGFFEAILIFIRFGAVDVDTKSIFVLLRKDKARKKLKDHLETLKLLEFNQKKMEIK
jgi:phosphatidylglycerophosphate synthase